MTIYFYSMFSFKKQFKLEINQTGDKNTLPSNMAPWHSGHHQRWKATCTFSTNLLPRKQVTKLKEKFHDLFFWSRLYIFIWKTVAYLQKRESKAQKCRKSERIGNAMSSVYWGCIHTPSVQVHSSTDPLLFTPKQKNREQRFLCLAGFSFSKVSMPHRVYLY